MVAGQRVHRVLPPPSSARDAKRIEAEIRSAIGRQVPVIPGDPPMVAVMDLYLRHARTLRSAGTARDHALRCGPWVEGRRASEARQIAASMTTDMAGEYAPATINRTLGAMSKALRLAWEIGMATENYAAHITRLPENNRREVVLSAAEVERIANAASEVVRAAIWIALYTGCRRGELCGIEPGDIGKSTITIRAGNTKTLKTRVIPIITPLRPWLRYLPLAINHEGIKTGFRRAREKAGLPHVTFHDLRRTCATMMIEAGVDLYVVSKLLGHSSVAVTQSRYAHLQVDAVAAGLERTFAPAITPARRKSKAPARK
jgi:integrase